MATVSSLGIGSGLDLSTLLDNLSTTEKGALTPITAQQTAYTAKLTAYGTLKSALTAFQTANTALNSADIFNATTASVSGSAFTATTASGAVAGKYTVSVSQLAQAQSLTSAPQTSTSTALGTAGSTGRTLTIAQSNSKTPVTINLTDAQTSLTGLRDAINGANAGVTASIIKVSGTNYRLSVTSNDTGASNAMTLSVSGDSALQSFLGYNGTSTDTSNGMTQSIAAQDAKLTVNNVAITSASNSVNDALEGITMNLTDVTTSDQVMTVSKDTSKASSAVTDWVNAYNSLQDTFSNLTQYTAVDPGADAQSTSNGALVGDSTLRTIQSQLKSMLTNADSTSSFKTLAQMGITQDPTSGKLTIDSTKLSTTLTSNSDDIKAMILGDGKTTGITTKIGSNLTSYMSTSGILTAATDGVNSTLKKLTQQYNDTNTRINDIIARTKTQFTALDVLMNSLNSTSTYLTQQFDAMTSSSSSKS